MRLDETLIAHIEYVEQHYYDYVINGNVESIVEPILKQLVNLKFGEIPIAGRKLLVKHAVASKCIENGIEVCMVDFEDFDVIRDANQYTKAIYFGDEGKKLIIFNMKMLTDRYSYGHHEYPSYREFTSSVESLICTAEHECEHYLQHMDTLNGVLSRRSYDYICFEVIDRFVSLEQIFQANQRREYQLNYDYKGVENQANIQGWYDAGRFLLRYGYNFSGIGKGIGKAWWNSRNRAQMAFQRVINVEGKKYKLLIDDYDVKMLIRHVSNHPELLKEFQQLSCFFDSNGQLKSDETLVSEYCKIEDEYPSNKTRHQVDSEQDVYREFLCFRFNSDDLQIPSDEESRKKYAKVCRDLILNDVISLQGAFDYDYEDKVKKEYEMIVNSKIKRISKVDDVLKQVDSNQSMQDSLAPYIVETCRVYETAKEMYRKMPADTESQLSELKSKFGITKKIEPRDISGRESAINI